MRFLLAVALALMVYLLFLYGGLDDDWDDGPARRRVMFFDKEPWPVIGGDTPQLCSGVVDNTVLVCPYVGSKYRVCIRVPSGMFSFVKEVLKLKPEDLKSHPVKFFLEEEMPGEWCLVIGTLAMSEALALWPYKGLPQWAVRGRCL